MAPSPPSLGVDGGARVAFRELEAAGETQLWESERARHPDLNRLHLRSLEAILNPTCSADSIISAVAYGATSQGLRVTQRDEGHIVAQRVEAPYLASFSTGRRRNSIGAEREEWRVFVAKLGVSKGTAATGGVDRVLLLSFMTDPVVKQTDFAVKGAAAVASLFGSVASVASGLGTGSFSGRDGVGGGGGGGGTSGGAGAGSGSSSCSSLSAVAIANLRSRQRADALVEAVVAELDALGCAAIDPGVVPTEDMPQQPSQATTATIAALERGRLPDEEDDDGGSTSRASRNSSSSSSSSNFSATAATPDVEAETTSISAEGVVLAPFEGGGGNARMFLSVPEAMEGGGGGGGDANAGRQSAQEIGREGGGREEEALDGETNSGALFAGGNGVDGGGDGDGATFVEVR